MKFNVIKEGKNDLVFELEGEQHTFPAMLCWTLSRDVKVVSAVYDIEHPLVGKPKIYLKTKGEEPRKAIAIALKTINSELDSLKKAVAKKK